MLRKVSCSAILRLPTSPVGVSSPKLAPAADVYVFRGGGFLFGRVGYPADRPVRLIGGSANSLLAKSDKSLKNRKFGVNHPRASADERRVPPAGSGPMLQRSIGRVSR